MQFKINEVQFKVSFSFFAIFLLIIPTGNARICFYSLFASLYHEVIHIIFIYLFGSELRSFSLSLFGANIIKNESIHITKIKEAVINISAPLVNVITGLLFFNISKDFSLVNIVIGIFNILPFYNFDGGRFLENVLLCVLSEKHTKLIIMMLSIFVTFVFTMLSFLIIVNGRNNYSLLILSLFMIFSVITNIIRN